MPYIILVTGIFSFVLLGLNHKNKVVWIFFIMLLGINVFIFSSFLYITKVSSYSYILNIDNYAYQWLSGFKISFYDIVTLINVGIALYMSALALFLTLFKETEKSFWQSVLKSLLSLLPIALFLVINTPQNYKNLYLAFHIAATEREAAHVTNQLFLITAVNYCVLIAYLLLPFLTLFRHWGHTCIKTKKHHAVILAICFLILDTFFLCFIAMAPFNILSPRPDTLLRFDSNTVLIGNQIFAYFSIAMLLAFNAALFLLWRFHILEQVDFMRKTTIRKNTRFLAADLRGMMHSYKNTLLSIEILTMKINSHFGSEESKNEVQEINTIARNSINSIGRFLDIFNTIRLSPENIELADCIVKALQEASIPPHIKIENRLLPGVYIYADAYHITKMFRNLIDNAADAIQAANQRDGRITLTMAREDNWAVIDLRDNGCGIEKKHVRKIFNPLFSTKQSYDNWGIGLSYVKEVLHAHLGSIHVESVVQKYTDFQVLLPLSKYRRLS